jgi:hypothetical protein
MEALNGSSGASYPSLGHLPAAEHRENDAKSH